jgi:hypothetical protein
LVVPSVIVASPISLLAFELHKYWGVLKAWSAGHGS